MTTGSAPTKSAQIRITRRSPEYWRVTFDNPPINVMGPEMVAEFQTLIQCVGGRRTRQSSGLRQRE